MLAITFGDMNDSRSQVKVSKPEASLPVDAHLCRLCDGWAQSRALRLRIWLFGKVVDRGSDHSGAERDHRSPRRRPADPHRLRGLDGARGGTVHGRERPAVGPGASPEPAFLLVSPRVPICRGSTRSPRRCGLATSSPCLMIWASAMLARICGSDMARSLV